MNSVEILDKKSVLKARCKEIISLCKQEIRDMTDEEKTEFEANKLEIRKLNSDLDELNKRLANLDLDLEDIEKRSEEDTEENKTEEDKEDKEDKEDDETDSEEEKTENNSDSEEDSDLDKKEKRNKNHSAMKKQFSLLKALNAVANNRSLDEATQKVIDMGREEMRKAGLSANGQIQIPFETRDTVTVTSEHDDVVETDFLDLLAPLRAKNVLVNAGARYLNGLVGDVQIPIMNASNVYWAGEIAEAQDAGTTFDSVKLAPKRITAYLDISKQFLVQDSIGAEEMIRQDLINAINSKLEATILGDAAGSATQPAGLFNGQTPVAVTDYASLCDAEADLEDANILGEPVYVMSNKAKAVVRSMDRAGDHTRLVYENGEVDGTKMYNTSNVANKLAIFGDFSNLAIGQWGSIDLTIDPYTMAKFGCIRLVINCYFDAKVIRPEAFVYMNLGE